jgi:nucleoside-diphosphate-sugar epimerase
MARKPTVLVTGAGGEMGHDLIQRLTAAGEQDVVALDIRPLDPPLAARCARTVVGDILDRHLLDRLRAEFEIGTIFHLAALLSTRAEFIPETAHEVNVQGTVNLLVAAREEARAHGRPVRFLFPSSIAVYGLPTVEAKAAAGRVGEQDWTLPITMYGCTKLHGEHLGRYFGRHYRQLAPEERPGVDFRAIRFPGLVSAETVPSGGTSDYAPEMLHAAAQGRPYACFVREDTHIPFMAMPDATSALLALLAAPSEALSWPVYNVTAFTATAGEWAARVRAAFPAARITFVPDPRRQAIVDSWPADLDDSRARRDWGFTPRHDLDGALRDYLLPAIRRRYRT